VLIIPVSNVLYKTHSAGADTPFKLTTQPLWCREVNIHITANKACYGDSNITTSYPEIAVGNGVSFQDINLNDLYFINETGGSNTVVSAVIIKMTPLRMSEIGVI